MITIQEKTLIEMFNLFVIHKSYWPHILSHE